MPSKNSNRTLYSSGGGAVAEDSTDSSMLVAPAIIYERYGIEPEH